MHAAFCAVQVDDNMMEGVAFSSINVRSISREVSVQFEHRTTICKVFSCHFEKRKIFSTS